MKNYGVIDERTPLTKTLPPDYVYMTNPNRLYRKQVHQFQCCICAIILGIFTIALAITILYSVDEDIIDVPPLPSDNASLQLLLSKSWPLPDDGVPAWKMETPTPQELETAVKAGQVMLAEKDKLEAENPSLPVDSPSYRHQVSLKTSARATNLARSAYLMEVATKTLVMNKGGPKNVTKTVGRGPALSTEWLPTEECGVGPLPPCPPSAYRTIDGSCNNPYKPNKWGVAMRPYRRQLAPAYADGISKPRTATDGSPLPSARDVSVTVHRPVYKDDPKFTVMLAVWGQFMDHDVTATAGTVGAGGKPISCCQNTSTPAHPECFPVYLSPEDPYYKQFGITCMEFVRSAPAPTCSLGPREQMNQVSSYLDASVVYGNTAELARSLRTFQGGQLKMLQTPDGRSLLPISTNLEDGCNREEENAKGKYCFMSGDARANENTHLTSLHTLMARQHNLVATQLADLNPEWGDEKLYQESRKIVAAQMQHITYNEFLPVLLGPALMEELDLNPKPSGYYSGYSPSVDATVSNNFATSAFRFAHTLLPALMKTVAKDWGSEESIEMHKMLFDPYKLYQTGALDKLLQGAISTKLERADSYFNTQVTQFLFQAIEEDDKPTAPKYGLDLVSLNVQRGRDHGLPAYPAWRQYCGLKVPKSFDDMVGMVDADSLEKMKAVYKSVDDIDMYTGALSEFPIEGGLVGPTVTCLVSDQFKRLKQGDSFWYETDKQPQAFSLPQLDEIRKTTLAGIICDTSDEVTTVQPQVMKSIGPDNARVPCSSIPRPDLTKWLETSNEIKKSIDGSVGLKYAKIPLTVTGGMIKTSSGEILWDGTLPTSVSLPLFNVKPMLGALPGGTFGSGVQWQGTTTITANVFEISGTFSYPVYVHGPIPFGSLYSAKWVNGEFKIKAAVSADTDISGLSFPSAYESPIYFSQEKINGSVVKKQFVLGAAQDDAPQVIGVEKLPVIIVGSYSPDKTSFNWAGKALITLPTTPATPKLVAPAAFPGAKLTTSGAFSVISGSVKLQSADGTSTNLWTGGFPAAIPVPLPFKVLAPGFPWAPLPVFGNGLEWSTSISGSLLEGSFSFPQYNRTFGFPQVNWLSGQFSLKVTPLQNVTLEELITPGIKYSSRIIFREEPAPLNVKLNSAFYDLNNENSIENLVVESQQVIDGVIPAPLILHGTFSPDKTVFYFNGKVILAVRPTKPKMEKQLGLLKSPEPSIVPWASPKFGGAVSAGYVTAGLNGAKPSTIWSGAVPVAIKTPTFFSPVFDEFGFKSFLFGNGVIWSGTLSGTTVKGTYTLPQTSKSITGITTQTWSGEFSFEVSPLWNATLASIFVPGAKYYSKINFQGAKYEPGITTLKGVPGVDPFVTMAAPIILQGTTSLDKTTFYWSGDFIITFRNKPILTFKIPPKPKKVDLSKPSVTIDVTSGSIVAGFTGAKQTQLWGGELPATIPYSSLLSKDSWNPIPSPDITWSGEVKDGTFQGTFALPTYKMNGTVEAVDWLVGTFSLKYVTRYGQPLENLVEPGKKYNFKLMLLPTQESSDPVSSGNKLVEFAQEAQEVIDDVKPGKVLLFGNYYSKSFFCYFVPFCTEKKEFYWSGALTLNFPESPKNNTINDLKMSPVQTAGKASPQFGGQVVSGSVEGGLNGESTNVWWSGKLPVAIPTSVFRTNITEATSGSSMFPGTYRINWSGTFIGNTLKGSFSFPQIVQNYPIPTIRTWSGQFSFEIEPLWNATLDGLIIPGVQYSSGLYFQGVKVVKEGDENSLNLGGSALGIQTAPLILQGNFTPDGTAFLWSGRFILAVKNSPSYPTFTLKKPAVTDDSGSTKPKTIVNFSVLSGQLTASNGSEPMTIWGGEMPISINTNLFNPTATPGASVSVNWTPISLAPQLEGTYSVTVYTRNSSVLMPVSYTGNFTFNYITKWGSSFMSLVKPGKQYTCNVVFKEITQSTQVSDVVPKRFVLGDAETTGEACTLVLSGKSTIKSGNAFYCNMIPFMCSNKLDTTWFSFSGDALLVIKPQADISQLLLKAPVPSVSNIPGFSKQVNATVIGGSIVAGPESDYPQTLWAGQLPVAIPLPVFWSDEGGDGGKVPAEDILHAHGVIWSGSQLGPRIEGSFSLPQYSKTGLKWWTGRFSFLFQASWGNIGELDEMIASGVNYNSRIIFRDISNPYPLTTPSQFDIDTAANLPIVLLGKYGPGRKIFYWSGNTIIAKRPNPWDPVNQTDLELGKAVNSPLLPTQFSGSVYDGTVTSESPSFFSISKTIWSGAIPTTIPFSAFWTGSLFSATFTKGITWTASSVSDSVITGTYSVPQISWNGITASVTWYKGDFQFYIRPLWNATITSLILPGVEYYSKINFQGVKPVLATDTSMGIPFVPPPTGIKAPIILQGTYSPDKTSFYWNGNFILNVKPMKDVITNPTEPVNQAPYMQLLGKPVKPEPGKPAPGKPSPGKPSSGKPGKPAPAWTTKPKLNVGALVSSGSVTNITEEEETPIWSGSIPVTIPLTDFNVSEGVNVIWSVSSLTPMLSGQYSIPQLAPGGDTFKVNWIHGNFSFALTTLWNTSLDIIEIGKQYATTVSAVASKGKKSAEPEMVSTIQSLIMESADIAGSSSGSINLKGTLSPDKLNFIWQGEAWFNQAKNTTSKNDTTDTKKKLKLEITDSVPLYLSQFGGSVYDGSVSSGSSGFFSFSKTLWSGNIPATIPISALWSGSIFSATFTKGITWTATSVSDSLIKGTYSVPQFSWDGITTSVTWYKGDFQFYIKPLWNATITSLIQPGVQYYSKIIFQGLKPVLETDNPVGGVPLVPPPTGIKAPIILQGTYSPDRTAFYWNGNFILNVKPIKDVSGGTVDSGDQTPNLQLAGPSPAVWPMKPNQRVGALITSGSVTNATGGGESTLWSGSIPVTIPLSKFNISKGVNVIWSASSLYPKFSGRYSIPQFMPSGETFKIQWIDGKFSFDVMPLWNTSLDIIEIGKEYATIIGTGATKLTTVEESELLSSFQSLIMESADLAGSPLAKINLKGYLTPDKLNFIWQGEAWFYPGKDTTSDTTTTLKLAKIDDKPLYLSQFGGSVYDGSVTSASSSFFSLSHTIWSGAIPATIPFSAFWTGSFFSATFTKGITWTATSVSDSFISGTYSVPQFSWNGLTTSVTWYKGDFQFYIRPLWNASISSLIQPGVEYYSKISFQGEKPVLTTGTGTSVGVPLIPPPTGIKAPIILQGTYSPDRTAFYWSGNFILNVKPMKDITTIPTDTVNQLLGKPVEPAKTAPVWPMKPKLNVGALISSGSVTNVTGEGEEIPLWSGSIPVTIPLTEFNVSKGVNVIWSVSSLYPTFSGQYSVPQYVSGTPFKINWIHGNFSFSLSTLWNTSLDIVEVGKQYATIISSVASKPKKAVETETLSALQSLIMDSADLAGSSLGKINLKGMLTPDKLNFIWQGEAWFYPAKNTTSKDNAIDTKKKLKLEMAESIPLYLSEFGGSVYDGSVTSSSSSFFSFTKTLWSGAIPATIPFSAFWSGSFFSVTFTKGVSWTATAVSDSSISGTYKVPQITWDGTSTSVTWYTGDFQFYYKPIWNATITSLIQPGVQYYSKINFQGEKPVLATDSSVGVPLVPTPGIKAPIILQGTYSPDRTSFSWNGNFILNVKPIKPGKIIA